MLQKNSFLEIFTSCYAGQKQTNSIFAQGNKLKLTQNTIQSKISLKKGRHPSFHQVRKLNSIQQMESKTTLQLKPRKFSLKQNQQDLHFHAQHKKSNQKKIDFPHPYTEILAKTCQISSTKKQMQAKYQTNEEKAVDGVQVQKTTKKICLKDIENCKTSRPTQNVREFKQLNKQHFISNLDSYKQSIVSMSYEIGGNQPQLQQSIVEMNFFNPRTSKMVELERCLRERR